MIKTIEMQFIKVLCSGTFIAFFAACFPVKHKQTVVPLKVNQIRVQQGQTVYGLAYLYNCRSQDIIEFNRLKPPYILAIGQILTLPHDASMHAAPHNKNKTTPSFATSKGNKPKKTHQSVASSEENSARPRLMPQNGKKTSSLTALPVKAPSLEMVDDLNEEIANFQTGTRQQFVNQSRKLSVNKAPIEAGALTSLSNSKTDKNVQVPFNKKQIEKNEALIQLSAC